MALLDVPKIASSHSVRWKKGYAHYTHEIKMQNIIKCLVRAECSTEIIKYFVHIPFFIRKNLRKAFNKFKTFVLFATFIIPPQLIHVPSHSCVFFCAHERRSYISTLLDLHK